MPKNVLDDVIRSMRRVHSRRFKFFLNRPHQVFFYITAVAIVLFCLFALLFSAVSWPQPRWMWWARLALFFALVYYVSAILHMGVMTVSSFRAIISPDRSLVGPLVGAFDEELGLKIRLAHTYERHELEYALDRITLLITQLRSRIALLIGALDKVGVFPLAIGAYFSLRELLKKQPPTPSELSWMLGAAIGLGIVYLAGLGMLGWVQGLEEISLVLKHAVQAKPSVTPSRDTDTPG